MTESAPPELLREVWEYPLFEALYGRRSRRFGLGFEMNEGPSKYRSPHAPLPLSEAEEALLVAAGVGFSGMALWDQSRPMPYRSADGRTFPSTSRGRRTALFFTNDQGVYVINPSAGAVGNIREAGTPAERDQVLDLYRHHRLVLQNRRLVIPRRAPPLCGHNLWDSNMPGSTLFMPVCDVSYSLIGLIAQFVDARLERFAATAGRGMNIVDDRFNFRPAGTEEWVASGFLDPGSILPLSRLERQACYFMFGEPAAICQNMFLVTEAMGIGGWMHCGILSTEIFEALGFTMSEPHGVAALANPVGLDGFFEAYCPPYFPSMDAAVDAVLTPMFANGINAGRTCAADGPRTVPDLGRRASRRCCRHLRRGLRMHQSGLQLHPSDLWPVPRHPRCDASDVAHASAPPRHRLLRPVPSARRLWRDPCRSHGEVALLDRLDQRERAHHSREGLHAAAPAAWRNRNGPARRTR